MIMKQVVLASGNSGKLREFQQLLADCELEVIPQSALAIGSVEETGLTFVENAILKARHACVHSGLPAIADDSGIAVDALQGRPGIYSARYSGAQATDADNNRKLLQELTGVATPLRTARYHCVLAFLRHAEDPTPLLCQGVWEGLILSEARGESGFGYDPLFFLPALNCTAAELDKSEKNRISHRGQAMAELLHQLRLLRS